MLLLEDVAPIAVQKLQMENYDVETIKGALSGDELKEKIKDVHAIGIRSRTPLTADILSHAEKLLCIGCFCIGTDKVDLSAAAMKGVPVFNSPYQNSRSVAELIISMIISLARQTGDRNLEMHTGVWKKTAKGCLEIRGKTLGIVGYGHIGSQLSVLAESMGMRVIFYDVHSQMPLGNSKPVADLKSLLSQSDFVTLHVPQLPETKNMIGKAELELMQKGAFLLNASRGTVVVIPELIAALNSGHLGGAYLDVYPEEPAENGATELFRELAKCPNTILSPHIGGSTTEAQVAIGEEVAHRFISFISTGNTYGSVNFPQMDLAYSGEGTHRIINVHANRPGVLKEINNILSVYNIEGQTLRTQKNIGYFIVDVDSQFSDEIRERIAALHASIKTRVVY
mgnify:CR=1 FL=1